MSRSIRLIAIAVVAAAFVPVAHATASPYPPEEPGAAAADWAREVPAAAGVGRPGVASGVKGVPAGA